MQDKLRGTISRMLGEEAKSLNVRIPASLHTRLDIHTARLGVTMREYVIRVLTERLDNEEQSTPRP